MARITSQELLDKLADLDYRVTSRREERVLRRAKTAARLFARDTGAVLPLYSALETLYEETGSVTLKTEIRRIEGSLFEHVRMLERPPSAQGRVYCPKCGGSPTVRLNREGYPGVCGSDFHRARV